MLPTEWPRFLSRLRQLARPSEFSESIAEPARQERYRVGSATRVRPAPTPPTTGIGDKSSVAAGGAAQPVGEASGVTRLFRARRLTAAAAAEQAGGSTRRLARDDLHEYAVLRAHAEQPAGARPLGLEPKSSLRRQSVEPAAIARAAAVLVERATVLSSSQYRKIESRSRPCVS